MLWLLDPGTLNGLEPLLAQLGLTVLPGVVVDAAAASVGADNPQRQSLLIIQMMRSAAI
ncbi:hypothetical protein [Chromatium okenii]|uniref:hypothetical protein n=1 Tax=Chromatium okenii TaxID=61644 RepID=UPI001F5B572F|nr:hypothetical protein [Chromatium okenii]